jgi:hypothetical protein
MPDGSIMAGSVHEGAVEGSERPATAEDVARFTTEPQFQISPRVQTAIDTQVAAVDYLKDAFPKSTITPITLRDGTTTVEVIAPNGAQIVVEPNAIIRVNPDIVRRDYARDVEEGRIDPENVTAKGAWLKVNRSGMMWLSGKANASTVFHESYHAAESMVLTPEEIKILQIKFGNAEQRAEAYEEFIQHRTDETLFQKIMQFFKDMWARVRNADPSYSFIFRQVQSGEVWNRNFRELRDGGYTDVGETFPISSRLADVDYKVAGERLQEVTDIKTAAFKRFFGNSTVVDANGNPMVVYHGTRAGERFTEFDIDKGELGAHFGPSGQANSALGTGMPDSRVIPAYLNISNPVRFKDMGTWAPSDCKEAQEENGHV